MSSAATLHRTLLIALASLALCTSAALARPADVPTPAFSGTIDENPLHVIEHSVDPYPEPATTPATDTGDGIAWLPLALAVLDALVVGLCGGSALHLVHARRHATRLAT